MDKDNKTPDIHRNEKPKNHHYFLKVFTLVLFSVICFSGAYFVEAYTSIVSTADKIHSDVGTNKERAATSKKIKATKPISILLLGIDTGADGRLDAGGNSDTMLLMTLNPKTQTTTLTSIPRDSLAQISGTDKFTMEKINSAYLYGGLKSTNAAPEMAMDTVKDFFNIPIDYYIAINMGGLVQIVDAVGGVDVDVPFDFAYDGSSFKKGKMHLDGKQSLAYARMRYDDPRGDFGRQERQQQVITSILNSAKSLGSIVGYQNILDSLSANLKTNLTFNDMVNIFNGYKGAAKHIEKKQAKMVFAKIYGSDYVVWPTSELQEFSDYFRKQLELTPETLKNQETRQNSLNTQFDWNSTDNTQEFEVYPPNE